MQVNGLQVNRIFGSFLPTLNLFEQFEYSELTQNMRQSGDIVFGDILQRMRVQALTAEDVMVRM